MRIDSLEAELRALTDQISRSNHRFMTLRDSDPADFAEKTTLGGQIVALRLRSTAVSQQIETAERQHVALRALIAALVESERAWTAGWQREIVEPLQRARDAMQGLLQLGAQRDALEHLIATSEGRQNRPLNARGAIRDELWRCLSKLELFQRRGGTRSDLSAFRAEIAILQGGKS